MAEMLKFARIQGDEKMTFLKAVPAVFCMALLGAAFSPNAKADDWNQKTVVTL